MGSSKVVGLFSRNERQKLQESLLGGRKSLMPRVASTSSHLDSTSTGVDEDIETLGLSLHQHEAAAFTSHGAVLPQHILRTSRIAERFTLFAANEQKSQRHQEEHQTSSFEYASTTMGSSYPRNSPTKRNNILIEWNWPLAVCGTLFVMLTSSYLAYMAVNTARHYGAGRQEIHDIASTCETESTPLLIRGRKFAPQEARHYDATAAR